MGLRQGASARAGENGGIAWTRSPDFECALAETSKRLADFEIYQQ